MSYLARTYDKTMIVLSQIYNVLLQSAISARLSLNPGHLLTVIGNSSLGFALRLGTATN